MIRLSRRAVSLVNTHARETDTWEELYNKVAEALPRSSTAYTLYVWCIENGIVLRVPEARPPLRKQTDPNLLPWLMENASADLCAAHLAKAARKAGFKVSDTTVTKLVRANALPIKRAYRKDMITDADILLLQELAPECKTQAQLYRRFRQQSGNEWSATLVALKCKEYGIELGTPSKKETLCWQCINAVPTGKHGCSWSRCFKPVEGWHAIPYEANNSYEVLTCPEFKRG